MLFLTSVQSHSHVRLFATPWTAAHQASLSITNSQSLLTHVHWVGDAIQPSHPLLSPFPPAFNLFQHQGLFQWVSSSHHQLLLLSRFSCVWLCATPQMAAHQAPRPWDSPGKNTGVGCHFLLQCMKVKCEIEVAQLCLTLSDPMDCSLPDSSVHGIFQARVLEWVAIASSESPN